MGQMKIVLQRVESAKVYHNTNMIAAINQGLVLLVGFERDESFNKHQIINRILNAKLFGKWEHSVKEMQYEILLLSQFTLFGKLKGRKLDFHHAETHLKAEEMFNTLIGMFKESYSNEKVKCGIFGEHSKIELVNDGPLTLIFDDINISYKHI